MTDEHSFSFNYCTKLKTFGQILIEYLLTGWIFGVRQKSTMKFWIRKYSISKIKDIIKETSRNRNVEQRPARHVIATRVVHPLKRAAKWTFIITKPDDEYVTPFIDIISCLVYCFKWIFFFFKCQLFVGRPWLISHELLANAMECRAHAVWSHAGNN